MKQGVDPTQPSSCNFYLEPLYQEDLPNASRETVGGRSPSQAGVRRRSAAENFCSPAGNERVAHVFLKTRSRNRRRPRVCTCPQPRACDQKYAPRGGSPFVLAWPAKGAPVAGYHEISPADIPAFLSIYKDLYRATRRYAVAGAAAATAASPFGLRRGQRFAKGVVLVAEERRAGKRENKASFAGHRGYRTTTGPGAEGARERGGRPDKRRAGPRR